MRLKFLLISTLVLTMMGMPNIAHAYAITLDEIVDGTVTIDKTDAAIGETVTLTATPNVNYKLDEIKVEAFLEYGYRCAVALDTVGENTFTFVIPETLSNGIAPSENTRFCISAFFIYDEESVTKYPIIVEDSEHGTVASDKDYAAVGETVTLTVTPDFHWFLYEVKVEAWDSRGWQGQMTLTQENDSVYTFVIPDTVLGPGSTQEPPNADTKFYVRASFEYDESWEVPHAIIIAPTEHGTVTADKAEAYIDETATLTAMPEDGYYCKDVTIVARYKDDEDNYVEQGSVTPTIAGDASDERNITFAIPYKLENGAKLDYNAEFYVTVTFDTEPSTGIEEISAGGNVLKGKRYNLLGQPVGKNYKGIVVQDGQKFLAK